MAPIPSDDRSDPIERKLALLSSAYASGRRDVAMSLAESIKDTLGYERSAMGASNAKPHSGFDEVTRVSELPKPWAGWARGWAYVKPISLFETVGLERSGEPVTLVLAFRPEHVSDPHREIRVAIVENDMNLRLVPCQVERVTRVPEGLRCEVLIRANVPQHARATYLVFSGNPFAELPEYVTDLRTRGEGYGLEISNHHYVAKLSPQMGQLERLTSRRQHGLELFAGGKGHGEPPGIDWAHDYVDKGGFQKLRMRNWSECPNFEIERGPLAVRVRRFGFPHSPLHPLFTPSRMHIDQSYTFYAGLPYFMKEGRMDVIQTVDITAMRDDEWVFSGYSFTDILWIDRAGKLREGPVPASDANDLWGVGFRHRDSHDAFIAIWLDHRADGLKAVGHNGSPSLDYPGHGQLWSRYPAQNTRLEAGVSIRQKNAYSLFGYSEGSVRWVEDLRHRLLHPVEVALAEVPKVGSARAVGALARPGESGDSGAIKTAIWKALREVKDEQLYAIDANVVDLGLIYDVRWRHGTAHVVMTMPHKGRPVVEFFVSQGGGRVSEGIRERLLRINGVNDVVVELAWEPAWNVGRLTEKGRKELGLGG